MAISFEFCYYRNRNLGCLLVKQKFDLGVRNVQSKIYILAEKGIKGLGLFLVFLLALPVGILVFFISEIWSLTDKLTDCLRQKKEMVNTK